MTRRELMLLVVRWEGGEVVDAQILLRALVKWFWEVEAQRSLEDVI